jgi:PPOX class probable F420-dependent enzyme
MSARLLAAASVGVRHRPHGSEQVRTPARWSKQRTVNAQDKDQAVAVTFNEATRRLLDGKNFATVATLNPDGGPHSAVVWFLREGDTVLLSTTTRRQKARNLARDPRVSLSVFELENPYNSVEIRGTAELVQDPGKTLPKQLSHRYLGVDPPAESDDEVRLIVRVIPEKVTNFSV